MLDWKYICSKKVANLISYTPNEFVIEYLTWGCSAIGVLSTSLEQYISSIAWVIYTLNESLKY